MQLTDWWAYIEYNRSIELQNRIKSKCSALRVCFGQFLTPMGQAARVKLPAKQKQKCKLHLIKKTGLHSKVN